MPAVEEKDDPKVEELSDEQKADLAHEKAVNEDPGAEPLLSVKEEAEKDAKEAEADDKTEDAKEEVKDDFDAEILSIAADLGVSEAEARGFSTVGDLEKALVKMSSRAELPTTATPKEKAEDQKEVKEELAKLRLEAGDDLDPEMVKKFNEIIDNQDKRHETKTKALEESVQQLQENVQANQTRQFYRELDGMFVKHGEAYAKELGEGSTLSMTGAHRTNRDKVEKEMGVIVTAHQLRRLPIPSDDELVSKALATVFGERKAKDNGEVEKKRGQYLRRSSSRSPAGPSKRTQARMDLREKLQALRGGDE